MIISGLPLLFGLIQAIAILLFFRFDPPSVYLQNKKINNGRKRAELALSQIYTNTNSALHELLIGYQLENTTDDSTQKINLLKNRVTPLFIGISIDVISLHYISTNDWNCVVAMLYYSHTVSQSIL